MRSDWRCPGNDSHLNDLESFDEIFSNVLILNSALKKHKKIPRVLPLLLQLPYKHSPNFIEMSFI